MFLSVRGCGLIFTLSFALDG